MILTEKIKVAGMQCRGCEGMVEEAVNRGEGIHFVKADYQKATVTIRFDTDKTSLPHIQAACTASGYPFELSVDTGGRRRFTLIRSISVLMVLFLVLISAREFGGRLSFPQINSRTTDGMIFIFGLLTGLHCVGMCGGFLIGYTARDTQQGRSLFRSHLFYGVGKILSYAMFGAFFGLVGSMFRITPVIGGISIGLAGLFLILYGLSMLNLFSVLKAIHVKHPSTIVHHAIEKKRIFQNPLFIGLVSGFLLGCGPLQMMYVLAAGQGDALVGAKILALFGLGTLPALFGFGVLTRLLSGTMTRRFFQASGGILIVMGSMMLHTGFMRTWSVNPDQHPRPHCCHCLK